MAYVMATSNMDEKQKDDFDSWLDDAARAYSGFHDDGSPGWWGDDDQAGQDALALLARMGGR